MLKDAVLFTHFQTRIFVKIIEPEAIKIFNCLIVRCLCLGFLCFFSFLMNGTAPEETVPWFIQPHFTASLFKGVFGFTGFVVVVWIQNYSQRGPLFTSVFTLDQLLHVNSLHLRLTLTLWALAH